MTISSSGCSKSRVCNVSCGSSLIGEYLEGLGESKNGDGEKCVGVEGEECTRVLRLNENGFGVDDVVAWMLSIDDVMWGISVEEPREGRLFGGDVEEVFLERGGEPSSDMVVSPLLCAARGEGLDRSGVEGRVTLPLRVIAGIDQVGAVLYYNEHKIIM